MRACANVCLHVGSGGRAVERRILNRGDSGSIPYAAAISFTLHLTVPFGRDTKTKSRWSPLSGVYVKGSKRSHTGGKCVTCSGLTHSREKDNSCVSPGLGCLYVNYLRPKCVYSPAKSLDVHKMENILRDIERPFSDHLH